MYTQTTEEIIAEVLASPEIAARQADERRRLQRAYIDLRARDHGGDRLAAAFDLHTQALMSRGDICDEFNMGIWAFYEARARYP